MCQAMKGTFGQSMYTLVLLRGPEITGWFGLPETTRRLFEPAGFSGLIK